MYQIPYRKATPKSYSAFCRLALLSREIDSNIDLKLEQFSGHPSFCKKRKSSALHGAFSLLDGTSLLVLVPLRLHALVVFMLRHFFAAFLLDGTHLDFSFG